MTAASWLAGGLTPDGAESYARLSLALLNLADRGQVAPCQRADRWHRWTSDDPAEREAAAHECGRCPLLPTCAEHAPHERHGTWAGTDRTPKQRTPGRPRRKS